MSESYPKWANEDTAEERLLGEHPKYKQRKKSIELEGHPPPQDLKRKPGVCMILRDKGRKFQ